MRTLEAGVPSPEFVEEHTVGRFIIELEFYALPGGQYKIWPYLIEAGARGASKVHFVLKGKFPTVAAARAAALRAGRGKIRARSAAADETTG